MSVLQFFHHCSVRLCSEVKKQSIVVDERHLTWDATKLCAVSAFVQKTDTDVRAQNGYRCTRMHTTAQDH